MTRRIPTKVGDVLILQTTKSFTIYAVGAVSTDGQQDFGKPSTEIRYISHRATAVDVAKTLLVPGGRIFLCDIDTDDWSEYAG